MYPNLRAELARKNITRGEIAKKCLGIRPSTLSLKLAGLSEFYFREAVDIKRYLGVDMPLEELFKQVPKETKDDCEN